jgi:hypothetical protein
VTNSPGVVTPSGMSLATDIDTVQLSFSPGYFFLISYPAILAEPVAFALLIARVQTLSEMNAASLPKVSTEGSEMSAEQRLSRDATIKMLLFIVKSIWFREYFKNKE